MRNRITVKRWSSVKDDGGGSEPVLDKSFQRWAKVDTRNGNDQYAEAQHQWKYDYKITVRFIKSDPILNEDTIAYDGKELKIESIQNDEEGKNFFQILRCTTVE